MGDCCLGLDPDLKCSVLLELRLGTLHRCIGHAIGEMLTIISPPEGSFPKSGDANIDPNIF